jgi:predicted membrane chloride channel (bestrophin family)
MSARCARVISTNAPPRKLSNWMGAYLNAQAAKTPMKC